MGKIERKMPTWYIISLMQMALIVTIRTRQEQLTGSNMGKEYVKGAYCHSAYLTYMQSTTCEMPDKMKHKLESRFPREISIISDVQIISL